MIFEGLNIMIFDRIYKIFFMSILGNRTTDSQNYFLIHNNEMQIDIYLGKISLFQLLSYTGRV